MEAPKPKNTFNSTQSLRFLDSLIENLPDMVFVKDAKDLKFVFVNRAGERLLGYSMQELIGKSDHDFFPREQAEHFIAKDREVLSSGKLEDISVEPIRTRHGQRLLHTKKIPIRNESGLPELLLGISEDVTELIESRERLKQSHETLEKRVLERTEELGIANAKLRESRDQLEAILRNGTDGIFTVDRRLHFEYVNEVGARILGFCTVSELMRSSVPELFTKLDIFDERGRLLRLEDLPRQQLLEGREPSPIVVQIANRSTGKRRWVMVSAAPILGENGIQSAVVVLKDFTDRKQTEDRQILLAKAGSALASTLDYDETLRGIARLVVPEIADWVFVNMVDQGNEPRMAVTYHSDPARVERVKRIREQYPRDWSSDFGDLRVLKTGQAELLPNVTEEMLIQLYRSPERARLIMTEFHPRSAMILPLKARLKVLGALVLVSEMPGRTYGPDDLVFAQEIAARAGTAIENALFFKQAREAIAARDEFLSIASHELKTPITSLKLQIQMSQRRIDFKGGLLPEPQFLARAFEIVNTQVNRLTVLVEDLLDVSRLRVGRMSLHLKEVDASALVSETVERFRSQFEGLKSPLSVDIQPGVRARWDESRIEQVIANLLSNALKYASGSEVKVSLMADHDHASIVVQDWGPGISRDQQQRIFERFERAVSSRNVSGLGLGLFISQGIIEAHLGQITLESEIGKGARFCVRLPLGPEIQDG